MCRSGARKRLFKVACDLYWLPNVVAHGAALDE